MGRHRILNSNNLVSFERIVPYHEYDFLKSAIHCAFAGNGSAGQLSVLSVFAKGVGARFRPLSVATSDQWGGTMLKVLDAHVEATVAFEGCRYQVALYREEDDALRVMYVAFILGMTPEARSAASLFHFLQRLSIEQSPLNGAMIEICRSTSDPQEFDNQMRLAVMKSPEDALDDIYIPQAIREHLELFVHVLSNYRSIGKPLRYLFAGKPGTAKTKIIRALARSCEGKATFLFTNGNEERIDALFDLAGLFSPVVLCIDDIDLMTGSRAEGLYAKHLASFLQKLDGFSGGDFFLLATTNDKSLVDIAASRPGRFDMIIDVSVIHPEQYLMLVRSKTSSEAILSLFDEDILCLLEGKKVSGAFIANVVKHLELFGSLSPKNISKEYLRNLINESHAGFYEELSVKRPGFQLA